MFENIAHDIVDQEIELLHQRLVIRRLDLIHPDISGNKFYKLKHNFLAAKRQRKHVLLTFGGAYSNHIAATAYAAQLFGFKSIGIIRGEELKAQPRNSTLATAEKFGMQLHFLTRSDYRKKNEAAFLAQFEQQFPNHYLIPEGGTNALAIQGTAEILKESDAQYDFICCAVGTGGTLAGLIEASHSNQHILGFSALKGDFLNDEIRLMTPKQNWNILDDFCCGGYAKTTPELIQFIQCFESEFQIPLEQVYTGKMLFGLSKLIERQYFPNSAKILVIHSGGLQGRNLT